MVWEPPRVSYYSWCVEDWVRVERASEKCVCAGTETSIICISAVYDKRSPELLSSSLLLRKKQMSGPRKMERKDIPPNTIFHLSVTVVFNQAVSCWLAPLQKQSVGAIMMMDSWILYHNALLLPLSSLPVAHPILHSKEPNELYLYKANSCSNWWVILQTYLTTTHSILDC